jgi:L-threonylcarbamoyladenylate synthase
MVGIGLESTIVDVSGAQPTILRPGYITKEMLEEVVGEVLVDPAVTSGQAGKNIVAKAPGMKYRHYAPKGQMTIVEGETEAVVDAINGLVKEKKSLGCRVAVIATEETKKRYHCDFVRSVGSRKTEGSIAAGLYDILREMDHLGAEFIYAESFEKDSLGRAIMNRMMKAAAYRMIQV